EAAAPRRDRAVPDVVELRPRLRVRPERRVLDVHAGVGAAPGADRPGEADGLARAAPGGGGGAGGHRPRPPPPAALRASRAAARDRRVLLRVARASRPRRVLAAARRARAVG